MLRYQNEIRNVNDQEWREQNPEECYLTERKLREGVHSLRKEMQIK